MVMAAIGCHKPVSNNLPPSEMLAHPGPGVDGPGPGVLSYQPAVPPVAASSQIYFVAPEGLTVQWDVTAPGRFDSEQLVMPARYNFPQGALYRLKLANIPGRPGVELFPSLEVGPAMPRTEAFLAHNAIPVEFTDEDFDQVMTGNFVTKVIYLPDPEFQEMALAGVGTLVSTRLDPGVDPIVEADRRGAIMAIVRLGNKDLAIASAMGEQMPGGPAGMGMQCPYPPGFVAGMTAPQYGMPISGTPIGLAGPPHIPLGVPAGLKEHTIVNHTRVSLPQPVTHERIDVRQEPGISYPEPANHVRIVERTSASLGNSASAPCPPDGAPSGGTAPCPTQPAPTN
ncbi:MAG: hypothetical protein ACLP9L_37340 [Thermoguttaceae bacterium]